MNASHIAERLLAEHRRGVAFSSLSDEFGIGDLGDAYAAQDAFVARLQAHGAVPAGYKIGLTSEAMQAMCGLDQPIAGIVHDTGLHASGATLQLSDYRRLGLEFEVAVRLATDLGTDGDGAPVTLRDVERAVGEVAPAIELIDDRGADYGSLDILTLVADNSWNAGLVLGEFTRTWPDLSRCIGKVSRDGAFVDEGSGSNVLGHPLEPVAWLAEHLRARCGGLKAGDIVTTGSFVRTLFPEGASDFRFAIEGLGEVSVAITAERDGGR